ncbi:ABC transporter permease [Amycolatopsis sp. H20-H5]|uniref:ABC transporter permease n=1 Tax=Amycolatopsis sp. H20-H5 TaxID=3046309 RepID=UPI002DB7017B|nr:ABC transporter permease [Amycolatopsis sp. H20-H5]MEC3974549.1 ABC transporter permease [Amycolatopsis sp. H20-H5]
MSAFAKILSVETKLTLRTPTWPVFGVLLPSALLLGIGSIPGMREPGPATGGARFIDGWAPSLIVLIVTMLGLQAIPAIIANYRESGILRRLSTTPVHPGKLLAAQLLINTVVALAGVGLLLAVGAAVFDIPGPRDPAGFLLALVLGTTSVFSLGLIAAAVAKTGKSAGALAMIAYLPIMVFGGVYLPRSLMPHVVQQIGPYLPPGVQALQDAWTGSGPQPLQLAVQAVFALGSGVIAARVFRWE